MLLSVPVYAQQEDDADLPDVEDSTAFALLSPKGAYLYPLPTDAELRQRLGKLRGCIELRATSAVQTYLRTYLHLRPEKARRILGRRLTYFPLFEEKLKEHGLPTDLKYLAVVESALNPRAVSRAGAVGLWQFMPVTGRDYKLRQNGVVDERSDPVKSTEAAVQYLKDLYRQYHDWALALAAYNSGPGRVNAAIKRAHSRNFWAIQRYLPRETRNYVPAFIAATYLCNYFYAHGVEPIEPDPDEQLITYLRVHESVTFQDIIEATGTAYTTVAELNAGFKRFYVPQDDEGYYVLLPVRVMPAFLRYLNGLGGRKYVIESLKANPSTNIGDGRYWQLTITLNQADQVERVAALLGCHPEHLKAWNQLTDDVIPAGQRIVVWRPVYVFKHTPVRIEVPGTPSTGETANIAATPTAAVVRREEADKYKRYLYHTVQRNECLEDIARQYGTPVDALRRMNNNCEGLCAGMRIKVKEL
ncbi:MAG: transglycosylase SLT domain-containing protein [Saprospiraceae bacterium]|nr:transglycosylase SLT domain-containing protein [Saprospiraceae bacterium]